MDHNKTMSPSDKYKIITQYGWVLGTRSQWLMWSKIQRGSIDLFGLLRRRLPNLFYVWKPMFEPPSTLLSLIYIYIYIYIGVCVCVEGRGGRVRLGSSYILYNFKEYYTTQIFFFLIVCEFWQIYLKTMINNLFKESFYGKRKKKQLIF